jgi:hypothetical protein
MPNTPFSHRVIVALIMYHLHSSHTKRAKYNALVTKYNSLLKESQAKDEYAERMRLQRNYMADLINERSLDTLDEFEVLLINSNLM